MGGVKNNITFDTNYTTPKNITYDELIFKIPACDLRDSVGGDYSDLATIVGFMNWSGLDQLLLDCWFRL
jgi:hypothetical protein